MKGYMDKGELADKFVVLVTFDKEEDAKALADAIKGHEDPNRFAVSYHEVVASHYDIDYNQHKLLIYPEPRNEGASDG